MAADGSKVFFGFQTSPGKKLLVAAINRMMAGEARVRGLSGAVPWDMAIAEIELEDPSGTWGRIEDAVFKAQPAGLLRGERLPFAGAGTTRLPRRCDAEFGHAACTTA